MALIFMNTGEPLTEAALSQVEARLSAALPSDLKTHYLRFNGGRPMPRFFPVDHEWAGVHSFYRIASDGLNSRFEEAYDSYNANEYAPKGFIPFAYDEGGWQFLYSLREETLGQIMLCQWDYFDDPERFIVPLAPSLEAFLKALAEDPEATPLQLSRLRDIGWSFWDPIGLLDPGEAWEGQPFADEYDRYLLAVASMLRDGYSTEECEAFLIEAAVVHMGLGLDRRGKVRPSSEPVSRGPAHATVTAIRAYVADLDADYTGS